MARACVWLDNNPTERAFQGPVVGRSNHFGFTSRRETDAAAILYTLVQTAKASGVSPSAYTPRQQQQGCLFTDGDGTKGRM